MPMAIPAIAPPGNALLDEPPAPAQSKAQGFEPVPNALRQSCCQWTLRVNRSRRYYYYREETLNAHWHPPGPDITGGLEYTDVAPGE